MDSAINYPHHNLAVFFASKFKEKQQRVDKN